MVELWVNHKQGKLEPGWIKQWTNPNKIQYSPSHSKVLISAKHNISRQNAAVKEARSPKHLVIKRFHTLEKYLFKLYAQTYSEKPQQL